MELLDCWSIYIHIYCSYIILIFLYHLILSDTFLQQICFYNSSVVLQCWELIVTTSMQSMRQAAQSSGKLSFRIARRCGLQYSEFVKTI